LLMSDPLRPQPADFERCLNFLCKKIETVALREGASEGDCGDLEGMLAAMPPMVRGHVTLMLEGIEIQTEFKDRVMAFAARYVLCLARDIWESNAHLVTHSPSAVDARRRLN
jgi:hypothetical protein